MKRCKYIMLVVSVRGSNLPPYKILYHKTQPKEQLLWAVIVNYQPKAWLKMNL
jgi:hypothetical protein